MYNPNEYKGVVNGQTTLTVKEKWAEVDSMLDAINNRKAKGLVPCFTGLEEYVDEQFNVTE